MGKNRVRPNKAKNGRHRWAKGHSSSSNPVTREHRNAAKAKALSTSFGPSSSVGMAGSGPNKLTAESLLKHDALMVGAKGGSAPSTGPSTREDDALTLGQTNKTFDTFASDWTQCSNVSFKRLIQKFDSKSAHHREMLAILAAVAEVVKEKGSGEESSTEYFAAILVTLETQETKEGLAATLALLSMVIKTVPQAVLQSKFAAFSKLLLQQLAAQEDGGSGGGGGGEESVAAGTSIVRSLIGCLSVALRAQSVSAWAQGNNSSAKKIHHGPTMQVYESLLGYVSHPKPKIRKAAQHAVCAVLKGSYVMTVDDAPQFHPAAHVTAAECLGRLNLAAEATDVLYTLLLLKEVIHVLPAASVKSVCDAVLGLMKVKTHPHLNTCAMQMLFGLFNSRPSLSSLPAELNARLISALYDYKPSVNDPKAIIAWLTVQQEGLINLAAADMNLCLAHLPTFFNEAKHGWASDHGQVAVAATTALKAVCNECIKPHIDEYAADKDGEEKLRKAFANVLEGLGYQFHAAWAQVLHLMAVVFEVAGASCHHFLAQYLATLAERRGADNFKPHVNELDYVVGKAVRKMGPRVVLEHVDLQITGDESSYDFQRSWLLPVLRDNVQNTDLAFFIDYFYPLAERCRLRSHKCINYDDKIGKKIYETLEFQIWSLLPGFCNGATDLGDSFRRIAKTLGDQLKIRKDLRMDILSSIRQLISKNLEHEKNRHVLANFAKNYLPILYNLYTTKPVGSDEKGQRLAVLETTKMYLRIAPKELVQHMFDNAFLVFSRESDFVKESTLDILQAQLPYQDKERIEKLYALVVNQVTSANHTEQKKAYRILEEIFSSGTEECNQFIIENLAQLQDVLLQSLAKASPSSQTYRLRCLVHIVRKLEGVRKEFAFRVIPEAVLCIKAVNAKARAEAFTLVVCVAEMLLKWSEGGDAENALKEYMEVLFAGLAGSPSLINCTLLAITRVFYEFRDIFPDAVSEMLVSNVCLLLTSQAREVVGSSLSFLRVFVTANAVFNTTRFLEPIMKALAEMSEDCKRHFRIKTRFLLERMVRKFGHDLLLGLVPKGDEVMQKRLKNIRKAHARKDRDDERRDKRSSGEDSDDEDGGDFKIRAKPKNMEEIMAEIDDSENDEMDMEEEGSGKRKKSKKSRQQQQQTFITEKGGGGGEGSIVDLLDPTAADKVTSQRPKSEAERAQMRDSRRKKEKNGGFEIAADGRLIIKDSDSDDGEDEEEEELKRRRGHLMEDEGSEDEDKSENTFRALVSANAARKRKMAGTSAGASSRRSASGPPSSKYRAGGTGIHRPLDKKGAAAAAASGPNNSFGSEYRSKKARGDVKRKGMPDPYAYVPLQRSSLNRRKRAKFEGTFKNVVKAAKEGAERGGRLANKMKKMKV